MMVLLTEENDPPVLLDFKRDVENFNNEVPIRFRIGDQELFGHSAEDGSEILELPLFILRFATYGMACLRLVKTDGRSALELDEYANEFLFKAAGHEHVDIYDTWGEITVRVRYDTLFKAWKKFAEEAYEAVSQRHPEMRTHFRWKLINEEPS